MKQPEFTDIAAMTFSECLNELESIVKMMESDRCDIDQLAAYTSRAAALLSVCRNRLTDTDREIRKIIDTINPAD